MSPFIPTPLFEIATAYKQMLSLQRRDENSMIHVLYAYMTGSKIIYCPSYKNNTIGIESYQVSDYCSDDYYNLLNKVYDYDMFLAKEHPENKKLFDELKPTIDAFDIKYGGYFKQERLSTRVRINLSLFGIKDRPIEITPLMPYNPLVIKKDDIDRRIEIISGEPVFAANKISDSIKNNYYVYQLRLISPTTFNSDTMFLQDPCIRIALFKKPEDANVYYENAVKNSLNFKKDIGYEYLEKKCLPAIQRFESYFSQKSKQM